MILELNVTFVSMSILYMVWLLILSTYHDLALHSWIAPSHICVTLSPFLCISKPCCAYA